VEFVDHYKVLQVDPDADPDVIQAAYRALARKYHPDVAGATEADGRMTAINAAWQVLRHADRRAAFDELRAKRVGGSTARKAAAKAAASAPPKAAPPKSAWPEGRPGYQQFNAKGPRAAAGSGDPGGPPGNPSGTILDFGRYKGWSLGEIAKQDPAFLEWFVRMPIARPYVHEINELLGVINRRNAAEAKAAEPAPKKGGLFRRR
jgi:curved DNA-binding protein CbpA